MHKIKQIKDLASKSDLIRHNAVFFIGTMGIAVFDYLYYPVISRLVTVPDFGEIQAVISLFMQLGIVLTAFGYVVTNIVSNASNRDANSLILRLEQIMLVVSGAGLAVLYGASFFFKDSFKLSSILPVLLVGILIIINIPSTSRAYILQGMKRLKEVSVAGIIYALGKLLLSVVLIYFLTNDIIASILGYIIAQVLMLIYVNSKLGNKYATIKESLKPMRFWRVSKKSEQLVRAELRYGLVIVIILSGLALLYSSDTILARLFFEPHDLGLYSAASSVARIIFFVTASVAGVLIASVKLNEKSDINFGILVKSLGLLGLIGGAGLLAFIATPQFFVKLLVGENYVAGATMLPLLSVVMFLCSVNNLLAIYQIALRRYLAVVPVVAGMVVLVVGLALFHANFTEFITVLLAANATVFVLLFVEILVEKKRGYLYGERDVVSRTAKL